MAYDKVDWHSGGDFPADLEPENGGTHIGMFLAWCILNGLSGEFHDEESPEALKAVRERRMTGREFLQQMCDEKLWEEDLNDEGNRFAKAYYSGADGKGYGTYLSDYEDLLSKGLPSTYHVADTWENYDKLAARISKRHAEFLKPASRSGSFLSRFLKR